MFFVRKPIRNRPHRNCVRRATLERLEPRQMLSASLPTQIVKASGAPSGVQVGQHFTFNLDYSVSDGNANLIGLGLRIHYNSTLLTFNKLSNLFTTGLGPQQGPQDDTANYDGDSSTNKFVVVQWFDMSGHWPGVATTRLGTADFIMRSDATPGATTKVGFSAYSKASGYELDAAPLSIFATNVNLDIDGSGDVPDPTYDATLIVRYLMGARGADLVRNSLSSGATRTNPTEIVAFLDQARSTMLDADGNGTADVLTDGALITRYLAGWSLDSRFTAGALGSGATRTSAETIGKFLDGYMPFRNDRPSGPVTPGLYNPTLAEFQLPDQIASDYKALQFGYGAAKNGWVPIVGDWDGDGVKTVGLYEPGASIFHLRNANEAGYSDLAFGFGPAGAGWKPIAGDWNGDGVDTVGLYDPTGSQFHLRNSNSTGLTDAVVSFGVAKAGWIPLAGDWNGDGVDTIGLYDPKKSTFYLRDANTSGFAEYTAAYGAAGGNALPVVGDWDRDHKDTIGLFDPKGDFLLRNSNVTGFADLVFRHLGATADSLPVAGAWGTTPAITLISDLL